MVAQFDAGRWSFGIGIAPRVALAAALEYDRESVELRAFIHCLCFGVFVVYEIPKWLADRWYGETGYSR